VRQLPRFCFFFFKKKEDLKGGAVRGPRNRGMAGDTPPNSTKMTMGGRRPLRDFSSGLWREGGDYPVPEGGSAVLAGGYFIFY